MFEQESANNTNKFVCPNDRQLALRAKLKTGWSMKTASLERGPAPQRDNSLPLREDEQATIIEVIKKAEQIDLLEQERIGRLIDRLEQLQRGALGRGPSQCLLCGEKFRILGGNKVVCVDCRKPACNKCAVEVTPNIRNINSPSKETWLCMICSETREIWKKSGAWFFKSFPKYILPGGQSNPPSLTFGSRRKWNRNSYRPGSNFRQRDFIDDSSSDDESKSWNRLHQRTNSNTESTYDPLEISPRSQNQLLFNREFSHRKSGNYTPFTRQTSSGESQSSKDTASICTINTTTECSRCTGTSGATLTATRTWDDLAMTTTSSDQADKGGTDLATISSRRDSMASRSMSELNWSDARSEERVSPSYSCCNNAGTIFKNILKAFKHNDSSVGTMEFSLTYDPIKLTLHCAIYRAKNLLSMDINGLSDPFCKIDILPTTKTSTRLRTKTVHKTRNPEFNENLTFYDITEDDLAKKTLHILVMDDDKFGHDYMGETRVPLAKLKIQNTIYLTLPLEALRSEQKGPLPAPDLTQWFDDDLWSRGQILLCLCYSTKRRALLVTIVKCANLLPMDNNGFSDPFVKLYLRPDPYHRKHKTTIKWKNLNPVYNEEFAFETRPTELSTQSLHLTVWDKDYGKSNDYLGGLVLGGLGSKGRRLKHWLDVIRYPDHRHEYWHNLTDEPIGD
ncbi:uncharacterized protein LOC108733899 [Agrilus planipennis]|uniref:Uncharacterized protein LOC108733899 n=1 Tax=Agrilus planipennis TaxID=224129 RepID=A0A7F5RI17_AGRPL|nr:uncharacterized protein LOC108733899 [Agrilus planipennis]